MKQQIICFDVCFMVIIAHFTGRRIECCIQILKFKDNFDSFIILYFPSSCTK